MVFVMHWPQWVFVALVCVVIFDDLDMLGPKLVFFFILTAVLIAGGFFSQACAQTVPQAAARYRLELTRAAHSQWGLDAPIASLAAQVHQESGWNPLAVSRVGAAGLAQFMPATATWWCQAKNIEDCTPTNPTWALRALVGYDYWLYQRVQAIDDCNSFGFALSAYNGGLGWVNRDKLLASSKGLDPLAWFDSVETVNAGRTAANWRENRDYPRRILRRITPAYIDAGWGEGACT